MGLVRRLEDSTGSWNSWGSRDLSVSTWSLQHRSFTEAGGRVRQRLFCFYDGGLEVTQYLFCLPLIVAAVTKACLEPQGGDRDSTS